jgi:hypothetical protein
MLGILDTNIKQSLQEGTKRWNGTSTLVLVHSRALLSHPLKQPARKREGLIPQLEFRDGIFEYPSPQLPKDARKQH